ncbi:MAG: pantoate kinase [Archaeoglobaceae archaeon]|nr:pantoate kinase [Archaeoglobaceae archaeon]MCX8152690.1 pantoate kinase [Archaeoglobaceae archaeon]MDW8013256.1 pantoate kinase [Archaeoglobaceae archaeon]
MIFAPASISCIFSPQIREDPRESGSVGVGFTINLGAFAEKSDELIINGKKTSFPTVEHVLKKFGMKGVNIRTQLPFGCGFGMSAASAISTSLLSNRSFIECADVAHEAEVLNLTGLGDVTNITFGGLIVRKTAACPSRVILSRFKLDVTLDFLILGEIPTREFLKERARDVQKEGLIWTKEFLKNPRLENLFYCSVNFAKNTGLIEEVEDVVEAVVSSGGMASMVMLGKSVFAYKGFEALKEFGEPFRAKIDCCGVRHVESGCNSMQDR